MDVWVLDNESTIRLAVFLGMFGGMALLEVLFPRRALRYSRMQRWPHNLLLVLLNSVLLRLVFPAASVGMAIWVQQNGYGMFNFVEMDWVIVTIASVLLLDLSIYAQHVAVHLVPILWRLHRVHHADPDYDVTTGLRFHPLEILLSMLYKFLIILILGPSVLAVLIFETLLNGMAMFNHANVKLPSWLDRILRMLLVTPDMHRIHHSVINKETDSNYGFNLSIWDRLFGTYTQMPTAGHDKIDIGLLEYRDPKKNISLGGLLRIPFSR